VGQRYRVREGIVIRRFELPSGDVIVTLLSHDGKWRGKVKKGRQPGGNQGRLSLFHDATVQHYARGEDDLPIITQVQLNGALPRLSDPAVYPYAHILAELVDSLTVDVHVGESIYELLASGLRGLSRHAAPEQVALLYAWRLLGQAGLAPRVLRCAVCNAGDPGPRFDAAAGGLVCGGCGSGLVLPPEVADDLRRIQTESLRDLLAAPLVRPDVHWQVMHRYTAYHVAELRSLGSLRRSAELA
jgi:DNA repair protein RecO (recombination protein O)